MQIEPEILLLLFPAYFSLVKKNEDCIIHNATQAPVVCLESQVLLLIAVICLPQADEELSLMSDKAPF